MLIALLALILIVLILIQWEIAASREMMRKMWTCPKCHGTGHGLGVSDPEEKCKLCFGTGNVFGEMNRRLAQTQGGLDALHNTVLEFGPVPPITGTGKTAFLIT